MTSIEELADSIGKLGIDKSTPWDKGECKTGITFDDFMAKHDCLWVRPDENPDRYLVIEKRFEEIRLIEQCVTLPTKIAKQEQVLLLHDKDYFEAVKSTKGEKDVEKLKQLADKYDSVYFNKFTYDCAIMAIQIRLLREQLIHSDHFSVTTVRSSIPKLSTLNRIRI